MWTAVYWLYWCYFNFTDFKIPQSSEICIVEESKRNLYYCACDYSVHTVVLYMNTVHEYLFLLSISLSEENKIEFLSWCREIRAEGRESQPHAGTMTQQKKFCSDSSWIGIGVGAVVEVCGNNILVCQPLATQRKETVIVLWSCPLNAHTNLDLSSIGPKREFLSQHLTYWKTSLCCVDGLALCCVMVCGVVLYCIALQQINAQCHTDRRLYIRTGHLQM